MIILKPSGESLRWVDDLQNLKRPRLLGRDGLWSLARLAYNSALIGACCSIWTVLVFLALEYWRFLRVGLVVEIGAVLVMLAAMAFGLLVFYRFQIREARRALTAGFWFGAGLNAPALIFLALQITVREYAAAGSTVGIALGVSLGVAAVCVVAWLWVRRWNEVVLLQDGTLCPHCGYSLIGNTTMLCPECGRDFTFRELGTTEEEFRGRCVDKSSLK